MWDDMTESRYTGDGQTRPEDRRHAEAMELRQASIDRSKDREIEDLMVLLIDLEAAGEAMGAVRRVRGCGLSGDHVRQDCCGDAIQDVDELAPWEEAESIRETCRRRSFGSRALVVT